MSAPVTTAAATTEAPAAPSTAVTVESLIEDVSIDGMCGVY